jgi:hypothetical protein
MKRNVAVTRYRIRVKDFGNIVPVLNNNCERIVPTLIVLLVFACPLFLAGLERRHLWNDEPRVAGIAAEMARSGDLVVPRLNGMPFLEKPPLYFWAASTAFRLFGENTYTARLISALSAIGGVVIVYLLARSMRFSTRGAFMSSFVLTTSAEYWSLGRRCLIDMTLCLFITAAMASFYHVVRMIRGRAFWYIVFVFSLGCSILTKGLVGLVIPLSVLTIWPLLSRNFSLRPWFLLLLGLVLCIIPITLWIWLLYGQLGGETVYKAVLANNVGRFTGSYSQHVEPFYYYLLKFPLQFFPWVLFVPMACAFHVREIRQNRNDDSSIFILLWFVVPFLLLSLSADKRGFYLLPLYPAAALFVGGAVGAILDGKETPTDWFKIPAGVLVWVAILVPVGFLCSYLYLKQPFTIYLLLFVPAFCLGFWAERRLSKKDYKGFLLKLAPALLSIFLMFDMAIAHIFNIKNSFEPIFNYCRNLKSEGIQIGLIHPKERMIGAAVFFLGSHVPILHEKRAIAEFLKSGAKTAAIVNKEYLNDLRETNILFKSIISKDEMVLVRAVETKREQDNAIKP